MIVNGSKSAVFLAVIAIFLLTCQDAVVLGNYHHPTSMTTLYKENNQWKNNNNKKNNLENHSSIPKSAFVSNKQVASQSAFSSSSSASSTTLMRGGSDVAAAVIVEDVTKGAVSRFWQGFQKEIVALFHGEYGIKEIFFTLLAIASIALASSAMIKEDGLLIDVLAWTCVILGPAAAILQRKVALLEGLREITNQLRNEVNQVTVNNSLLQTQNQRLQKNTQKLKNSEAALQQISSAQGMSVDKLVEQVQEYRVIQAKMRLDLQSKIQQNLLDVFMRSDRDENFMIDDDEVDKLIRRLKNIPSVTLNEEKFRATLKREGGDIMKFADKHFNDEKVRLKEGIFQY